MLTLGELPRLFDVLREATSALPLNLKHTPQCFDTIGFMCAKLTVHRLIPADREN